VAAEHTDTDEFRGARFTGVDLRDAVFRDCDLRGIKVADAWLTDVNISGLIGNFVVNEVDIAPLVEAELDRRHPERAQLREARSADDLRAMWATIESLWAGTVERGRALGEAATHERVDEEWSLVETLRHLVFCTDAWAMRTVLDEPRPYHPLGFAHSSYPPGDALELGIRLDARPSLDEVLAARADRQAVMRGILDGLTDDGQARECARAPAPGYPDEVRTVGRCLRVVMREEIAHRLYAERDLAMLEERAGGVSQEPV
jgi:DinB superfamily/Pentapeptide repeats (8 copies)